MVYVIRHDAMHLTGKDLSTQLLVGNLGLNVNAMNGNITIGLGMYQLYILILWKVLPEFWREAQVEALNYAKARGLGEVPLSYVVVKRRNAPIEQAWVIQDLAQWIKEKQ